MDKDFWLSRWQNKEIAFHETYTNPKLKKHFSALTLPNGRIFVPLCGKTNDIAWLLGQGLSVLGAELSETAIVELFQSLGVEPNVSVIGTFKRYSATNIDIFVGDIFDLTPQNVGKIDAIYDRGALVALPEKMRQDYSQKLLELGEKAPQLLLTYDYDQSTMQGPPFAISKQVLENLYSPPYSINLLESSKPEGNLLERHDDILECAWLLCRG